MEVWNAGVKQAGAISVDSLEELIDVVRCLTYLGKTKGDRIGIIGGSGGQSVSMSDDFSSYGFTVPQLSDKTLERMGSFFQLIGASYFNPVDIGGINRDNLGEILDLLTSDPNIEILAIMRGIQARRRSHEDLVDELKLYLSLIHI